MASPNEKTFIPGIILDEVKDRDKIISLGFTNKMEISETILPSEFGAVTRFNANGKEVPNKKGGKITKYMEFEWTRQEWAGRGRTREVTGIVTRAIEMWPRDFFPPPSVQLTISKKEDGEIYITTEDTKFNESSQRDALHKINIILEVFGSCDILNEDQVPVLKNLHTLNWTILPPGKRPWTEQRELLKPVFDAIKDKRTMPVMDSRFEEINKLGADFTATGNQGFKGYVIFGFPSKNTYIFESALYGNAIYIFEKNWEELSKLTKADILNAKLHLNRITHSGERANVLDKIIKILKK
jgi:hypothetical protein